MKTVLLFLWLGLLSLFTLGFSVRPNRVSIMPVNRPASRRAALITTTNPILFVTQVPTPSDFKTAVTVFGSHLADTAAAGRGGDLWIRYPDGSLKNLTQAAGYGVSSGFQGANSIAVRDPSIYWDGTKAIFSMVVGAPTTGSLQPPTYYWQLYEITGLGQNQTPVITKIPNQPANYNNVSPIYGTDDRIIFTSDRPRKGVEHIYPELDEYDMFPTNTGLWSLDPSSGDLFQMDVMPSGDFNPIIDSYGRVVFTRWDHLQRDQQADVDALQGGQCKFCTFNYADESINATPLATNTEVFPEPRPQRTDLLAGTNLAGHHMDFFFPWTIREDGSGGETVNHIGRHELADFIPASFTDDPNLKTFSATTTIRFNPNPIVHFLQVKEDPLHPGTYFGVDSLELTHASGQIISLTAPPNLDADQLQITYITDRQTYYTKPSLTVTSTGHYRDPLPMSDGSLIAAHTAITDFDYYIGNPATPKSRFDFRLKTLTLSGNGYWAANQLLTNGISKTVSYYITTTLVTYAGNLWEIYPVEVRARSRPSTLIAPALAAPEQQIFQQAGVDVNQLKAYLTQHNLALAISRNVTTRDHNDVQQPFRLQVGITGTQTLGGFGGTIYSIDYLQFFQGDQLRGLGGTSTPQPGRRVLAQPMHDPQATANNLPNPTGPTGSVALASDGSMAAFVPARRPMSWQLTDGTGQAVVRERVWVTFQPGEIRTCTSCHGLNESDQAGDPAPTNPPQALLQLLQYWKNSAASGQSVYLPVVIK